MCGAREIADKQNHPFSSVIRVVLFTWSNGTKEITRLSLFSSGKRFLQIDGKYEGRSDKKEQN